MAKTSSGDWKLVGEDGRGASTSPGRQGPGTPEEGGPVTKTSLLCLLEKQEYRCALTGDKLEMDSTTVDHATPLSKGGKHDMSNAIIVTTEVNKAKHSMGVEEFVDLCRRVVAWADRPPAT